MAYSETSPNTGDVLASMDANSVRKLWQKTLDMYEQSTDFFQQYEGSKSSPIWTRTDLSKGGGQTLTISNRAGFYGEGKIGDELFEDETDFEEDLINSYKLKVDFVRNAHSMTERTEEVMGMRGELGDGTAAELGKWMGRKKTEAMLMMYRELGGTGNLILAGGCLSESELTSAHQLGWDEICTMGAMLEPLGGQPAKVGMMNGNPVYRYMVFGTTVALNGLEQDPDFKQVLREAGVRGNGNSLFEGGYVDVRGNYIRKYNPIDHDGHGPVGSPLNAKAFLGVAITAGTTAIDVKMGGSAAAAAKTAKFYAKYFPNFAYRFYPGSDTGDVLTAGSDEKYFLIVNPRSGSGGDGKIGMYAYTTGNDGHKITITARLGSAASGVRATTVGSVTWDTGVWNGKHTDAHPVGATIVHCNAKGQPIGDTLMLGNASAVRGYGKYRNRRTEDSKNGGHVHQRFITSVFGQSLRKDTQGRAVGYTRLRHAINYPGLGIPTIV